MDVYTNETKSGISKDAVTHRTKVKKVIMYYYNICMLIKISVF